jgi:lipopolysaccharide/colanic/teichoic acid biosynthesis glycosyltransferase
VLRGDISLVGPWPETQNFKDCFELRFSRVLEYRPGSWDRVRLYPEGADPVAYYKAVLFPLKTRINLAYYQNGSRLLTSAGSSAASWWYLASIRNCPKLLMKVSNQHA